MRFLLWGYLLVAGKRAFNPSTRVRFSLALPLMLAGWGVGQTGASLKADHNIVPPDMTLTVTGRSGITIVAPTDLNGMPKTILTCEPVLNGEEWTPHVRNCKLQNGATIDDIVNTMTDVRETEHRLWQEDNARLRSLADRVVALTKKANKNAMQCSKDFKEFIRTAEAYAKGNKQ